MRSRISSLVLYSVLLLLHVRRQASAHVEMKEPPPRHSQFSKYYVDNDDVDYNMKSPLGPIVGYPCRNFKAGPVQGTLVAGHPFHVQFDGVATHLGGDCQFAVSYDNGTTFAVIWDKLSSCFLDTVSGGYDVPVPDAIPAATRAIFAWTWINGLGSREYYMNCADIRIENYGHQEPLTAHELLVVNLPGKQTVAERTGREEDQLTPLLKQRAFVSVGKPMDLVKAEEKSARQNRAGNGGDGNGDGDGGSDSATDKQDGADGSGESSSSIPDEITSFVLVTKTITDDDDGDGGNLDEGFAYNQGDDVRGLEKTGNGLTVLSDDGEISEYLGSFKKPLGADANFYDTFPLSTQHMPSEDSLDLWPSSSGSKSLSVDLFTGTPLPLSPLDLGLPSLAPAGSLGQPHGTAGAGIATAANATASAMASPSLVSRFSTVTISNRPVLQVVVSADNTAAIPASLTISYSV